MEGILLRAAIGLTVINTGVLLWLYQQPVPPDRIPDIEDVPDPFENTMVEEPTERESREMATLDAILAERLIAEAERQGAVPALPDIALRQAASSAPADSDAALSLLAAYEQGFAALGLSLDELAR